jgi:hypothetical protein
MAAAADTPLIALFISSSFSDPLMAALLSPTPDTVSHFFDRPPGPPGRLQSDFITVDFHPVERSKAHREHGVPHVFYRQQSVPHGAVRGSPDLLTPSVATTELRLRPLARPATHLSVRTMWRIATTGGG